MKKERLQQIEKIFEKHEFIAWKKDIIQANVTEKEIQELIDKEIIWENYPNVLVFDIVNDDEFYEAQMYSQLKPYWGLSAIMLHDLTTNVAHYHYFLSKTKNNPLAENIKYRIKNYNEEELEYIDSWFGRKILVTNLEKTIIDCLAYNEFDSYLEEVLANYMENDRKNIEKLKKYAKKYQIDLTNYKILYENL